MDLSILIVGYQRCQMLARCLASIYEHTHALEFDVHVVDNASTDGTADMVRAQFPQVHLYVNPEPRFFAANHNSMLKLAQGRYALLLNDDTYLTDNAFKTMVAFADTHPQSGAIGCRQYDGQGRFRPSAGNLPTLWNISLWASGLDRLAWVRRHCRTRIITWPAFYDQVRPVDWLSGACLMIRRSVLAHVDGLDESLGLNNEDKDMCYRIRQAGFEVYHIPQASIVHYGQGDDPARRRLLKIWGNRSLLVYLRKHRPTLLPWARRILMAGAAGRVCGGWILKHLPSHQRAGQELLDTYRGVWEALTLEQ